jgi:hypothetical protein
MTESPISELFANTRPGLAGTVTSETLGALADLDGTWIGTGFNLIALPLFHHEGIIPFRLKLNTTVEVLEFTPIGAAVPNRGFEQPDLEIHGLHYLQKVADGITHEPLHIEPGFWLNVPPSPASAGQRQVVRQSTIPHGNSVLATGRALSVEGGPTIAPTLSIPISHAGHPIGNAFYLSPYADAKADMQQQVRPTAFKPEYVTDPSQALRDVLKAQEARGQTIEHTRVLIASTKPPDARSKPAGVIGNIPSDIGTTSLDTIFWIERVRGPELAETVGPPTFLQLQYVQNVMLDFDNILWPHISVATLTKQ